MVVAGRARDVLVRMSELCHLLLHPLSEQEALTLSSGESYKSLGEIPPLMWRGERKEHNFHWLHASATLCFLVEEF